MIATTLPFSICSEMSFKTTFSPNAFLSRVMSIRGRDDRGCDIQTSFGPAPYSMRLAHIVTGKSTRK